MSYVKNVDSLYIIKIKRIVPYLKWKEILDSRFVESEFYQEVGWSSQLNKVCYPK